MPYRNMFKKILFCTDLNSDSMSAFHYALNIAEGNQGSEIMILHVIPEPDAQFWKSYLYEVADVDIKAEHDIDSKISDAYLRNIPESIPSSIRTVTGNAGEQILEISRTENINLIIIGRGRGSNIINRLLGDVIKRLIHKAQCPVLVVPEE